MKWTFIFRRVEAMSKCYILIGIFQDIVEGGLKGMYMRIYVLTTIHLSNATPDRCNNLCIEGGQSCRQYSRTIIVRKSMAYNILICILRCAQ